MTVYPLVPAGVEADTAAGVVVVDIAAGVVVDTVGVVADTVGEEAGTAAGVVLCIVTL